MLTTNDLYEKLGLAFDFGELVKFELSRGLELRTNEMYVKRGIVGNSQNPNSHRTIVGTIANYRPLKPGDLEIECITDDGKEVSLRLSQCKNLRILE